MSTLQSVMGTQIALNLYHNKQSNSGQFYVCYLWISGRISLSCIPRCVVPGSQSACRCDLTKSWDRFLKCSPILLPLEVQWVPIFFYTPNSWYRLVLQFKQINMDKMIFHDCFHLLLWLLLSLSIFWFVYCFGGLFHFNCLFMCVLIFFPLGLSIFCGFKGIPCTFLHFQFWILQVFS